MKVSRVILNNFAQHKKVEHLFHENIIGVVGKNGSGKSNFANAISIAMTGEFGKKKKKDLITFGEKTGDIFVEGDINGNIFSISRSLHSNQCTLKYGNEEIDGADSVNEKILELLGCEKSFLSNMVFVSQTDILGVLFGSAAERNKTLRKFFGLQKLEELDDALTSWHRNISYPVLIDEDQAKNAISSIRSMIEENESSIQSKLSEIEGLRESIDGIDLNKITKNYSDSLSKNRLSEEISRVIDQLAASEKELSLLVEPSVDLEKMQKLKDISENIDLIIGAQKNELEILQVFLGHKSGSMTECPLCNSSVGSENLDNFRSREAKLRQDIDKNVFKSNEYKKQLRQIDHVISTYEVEKKQILKSISNSKELLDIKKKEFDSKLFPAHPPSKYQDGISFYNNVTSSIHKLESDIALIESTNKKLQIQLDTHLSDLKKANNSKLLYSGTKVHHSRISRIRDIFRHDGLSGVYINHQMNKMSQSINEYLNRFGAIYNVKLGQDNEFVCDFGNKVRPSSDLSCGQKVVLSLAFRFAAREIFTTGVNLIVLDEPTTWLDRETILNFKNIIESVSELSDTNNLQTMIVTHERSLMPYFKQTIEF
jgi:DNA repair exonuclease SbcCD ATPase subunit